MNLDVSCSFFRNVNAKEWTVLVKSKEVGEMAADAKTNGTMLDAFMMGEIVVRILRAISAKMILPKLRPMLELIIFLSNKSSFVSLT